jgi:tRNA A37 threonylcarbamoyladenosine dehydratase
VGSYAVEALARAGIGYLRLVDFDVVRESNANRQLYALTSTVDRPKVEVAAERVRDINPACRVDARPIFVNEKTVADVVAGPLDVIIDAIDSMNPKVTLLASAVATGARIISCMGAATRLDPSAIRIEDISRTEKCPLARLIRKRLRQRGVVEGIQCVYSTEPVPAGAVTRPADAGEEPPQAGPGRKRSVLGSLSYLTGMFGLLAAGAAICHIARLPNPPPYFMLDRRRA